MAKEIIKEIGGIMPENLPTEESNKKLETTTIIKFQQMTVRELINHLQTLPPETKVVIRGYEGGYNDILQLKKVKIRPKDNAYWFDGEFEDSNDADTIDAVNLFGENKNPKDD